MEVHHHKAAHHKRSWKEYFTEFIMLFAAVTLGFFAENLREHQIEKSREIQFLQNIRYDLEQDLKEIELTIAFNKEKQLLNDSLVEAFKNQAYKYDLPRFYYLTKNAIIRKFFDHSSTGFTQLKNAGGLRLVEDESIIKKIITIENTIMLIGKLQESMDQNLLLLREHQSELLDPVTNNEMNNNQNLKVANIAKIILRRYNYPVNPRPLTTNDPKAIAKLLNLAVGSVNSTFHINNYLTQLKKQEEELSKEILEKFGNKFKH